MKNNTDMLMNFIIKSIENIFLKFCNLFFRLTKLANLIYKFLPTYKHDILFYSTLLAKLMESALKVIEINVHIQEIAYNVTLRNPEAIKAIKRIPPVIVGKTFEALVSAERTQVNISHE